MDTQLPSLSSYFGNLLGTPVLDVASVEIVHGPASALYGGTSGRCSIASRSRTKKQLAKSPDHDQVGAFCWVFVPRRGERAVGAARVGSLLANGR